MFSRVIAGPEKYFSTTLAWKEKKQIQSTYNTHLGRDLNIRAKVQMATVLTSSSAKTEKLKKDPK